MMFLTFLSNHDFADNRASCLPLRELRVATPGARAEIMDDEGNVLPPLQKGEIVAQGSFVFPGYYKNDEATGWKSRQQQVPSVGPAI